MILVEMSQILLFVFGFLVLFCTHEGEAIKCYECNSHNDSRCAMDIPPEALQKDCQEHTEGSKYTMCRKITQSIDFEVNGRNDLRCVLKPKPEVTCCDWGALVKCRFAERAVQPDSRIIRSCGWDESNYKGRCYQRSGFGGRQEVCSCLTDLCNGATSSFNIPALTVVLVAALQFSISKLVF